MDFQQVVRRRRMVRAYRPERRVPPEARDRLLRNALRAPSAGFSQGAAYVVLEDDADRERFWAATSGSRPADGWLARMRQAPLLITCWCSEQAYRERYAERDKAAAGSFSAPFWYVDGGMGVLLILQTAVDEGLGACFFGVPPDRVAAVRTALGVPPGWQPVGVVSVGHPDPGRDPRSPSVGRGRRPAHEVIHMGQWGS
ncbi:nitroreductase family protein [Cumulibacter manganitolerans]|uniref:nitroreductase family protein n=1 Tax=Cumulibacter manganitolerans TaxID=1884992 RepID=UPI00129617A9|nr:nitroreductase family protein [Cumulibacter manganitolerans]